MTSSEWYKNNRERILEERKANPRKILYINAKSRAKKNKIPFDIEETDIIVPKHCPYLGLELRVASEKLADYSPSLDRIDPTKGYTKGNIEVISHLANAVKHKLTKEQLIMFAENVLKRMK